MLLDGASEGVDVARAAMPTQGLPAIERTPGGLHRGVDVRLRALGDRGQLLPVGRIDDLEMLPGLDPLSIDEMAELSAMGGDPPESLLVALGGRAVIHRLENLCDARHSRLWSGVVLSY